MIKIFNEANGGFGSSEVISDNSKDGILSEIIERVSSANRFKSSIQNDQATLMSPNEMVAVGINTMTGDIYIMTKAATFQEDNVNTFFEDVSSAQKLISDFTEELEKISR